MSESTDPYLTSVLAAVERDRDKEAAEIHERIARGAPELAEYPDRVRRFLSNVQRLLIVTNGVEGARFAEEVARDAGIIAIAGPLYRQMYADIEARTYTPRIVITREPTR